jgi:uncharacterized protein (DUF2062 family)
MTEERNTTEGFWHRPVTRGVVNGVVFAGLLMAIQTGGLFNVARPLTQDLFVEGAFAGVIFGFVMYVIELWKKQRRMNAEKAARLAVERRLEEEEEKTDGEEREDDRRG